jgi:hypothetical protein
MNPGQIGPVEGLLLQEELGKREEWQQKKEEQRDQILPPFDTRVLSGYSVFEG